ncbi:hypothetical protein NM688_g140 [Phlebia brevispora]|uniref:Uncharacterized protein n=1 Tax=Phlebia brevispora TaxID=194682 RepID=A0ACC1TEX9_9APHY|nr:hypothetical protein NM688_g140 [Phlebia brevispora]
MSFLRLAVRSVARPRFAAAAIPPMRGQFLQKATYSAAAPLTRDTITTRVVDVLKGFEKVDPAKLTVKSSFDKDLGLDSLDAVEVVMAVEEEFGIEIPDAEADEIKTVEQVIEYIAKTPDAGTPSEAAMKHGVAFRKFSRTSSHRMLMLRNLVTSLLKHEQIKTTLPKARDAARLADKLITLGKKGDLTAFNKANAFVLEPEVLPKLFGPLAQRYAGRVGGYTRVHKYGNRPGDNAPHAILELVDNPRDIKFEMTARTIGWEVLGKRLGQSGPQGLIKSGVEGVKEVIEQEQKLAPKEKGELREKTRWNLQKILRFRGADAVKQLQQKAEGHIDSLLARPLAVRQLLNAQASKEDNEQLALTANAFRLKAGQTLPGGTKPTLRLAAGALGKDRRLPKWIERRKLGINRDFSALWNNF